MKCRFQVRDIVINIVWAGFISNRENEPFANFCWQMALVFIVLSNYKEREEEHNDKEREVKCGEDEEVFSCLALIVL